MAAALIKSRRFNSFAMGNLQTAIIAAGGLVGQAFSPAKVYAMRR
jgi:hypothetical protein